RGQDRTRLNRIAPSITPLIPYSGEREQLPVVNFETIRLFHFPDTLPLIEPICRDQAPAGLQSITECRLGAGGFRPGVDHAGSSGAVLRPRWNKAPVNERQFSHRFL